MHILLLLEVLHLNRQGALLDIMNITYSHPDISKDGQKVAQISDKQGEILITQANMSGAVKGAIKRALGVDAATFKVVKAFPPHGGPGEPVTGSISPLETRSEPQAREASPPSTPSPATPSDGRWTEGGFTYIPVSDPSQEGWVTDKICRVLKQ